MPTSKQERDFKDYLNQKIEASLSNDALQEAIDFISSEFEPDDIFTTKQLAAWAEGEGYIKEEKY